MRFDEANLAASKPGVPPVAWAADLETCRNQKAAETETADAASLNYQRFYANYYVGLYLECIGKTDEARRYLRQATKHKNDHYMWHVARVHAARLPKAK